MLKNWFCTSTLLVLFFYGFSFQAPLEALLPKFSQLASQGIDIRLQEPEYHDGVMTTDKGGIVENKDMYLQAKNIRYIRREENGKLMHSIEASENLFFKFKGRTYTGSRIIYDLTTDHSVIFDGRTQSKTWFVGGKRIELNPDGSGTIYDAFITTSENEDSDWSIKAKEVDLAKTGALKAKNIKVLVDQIPIFWMPRITKDMNEGASSSQLKYRFQYRHNHGAIAGVVFKFIETERWKTQFLLDIGFTKGLPPKGFHPRGFGGGFEARYSSADGMERFSTVNYFARDIKLANEDVVNQTRYMFQAKYQNQFFEDPVSFRVSFDKQSDPYVSGDYIKRGLDSSRVGKTQATFWKREPNWVSALNARVRVNKFQTVKQELPLFTWSMRPIELGFTQCVLDSRFNAGYLDYKYTDKIKQRSHVRDFHSTRIEANQKLYRNFSLKGVSLTPYVGYRVIGYGNSPQHNAKLLALAEAGAECHTRFIRNSSYGRQAIEPYVQYNFLTSPSVAPRKHYVFDMEDGWHRLSSLRFGLRSVFTSKQVSDFEKKLMIDLYARAFFDTPAIKRTIPRIYLDGQWKATKRTRYTLGSAWNLERKNIDHINVKGDFTLTEDIALALEYRHRSSFSWRKVDTNNFVIDSFLSEKRLRRSPLSDRRDTALAHLFCRLTSRLSVELLARHGWRRHYQPSYTEYEGRIISILKGAFKITFFIEHQIAGRTKFGIDFSVGSRMPSTSTKITRLGQTNYE